MLRSYILIRGGLHSCATNMISYFKFRLAIGRLGIPIWHRVISMQQEIDNSKEIYHSFDVDIFIYFQFIFLISNR